jgi:Uri superfamily endonuclease
MISYQLHINITNNTQIEIGKLGKFTFPRGCYIYTGSAKKNIDKRIKRHQSNSSDKKLHWHVDYLLNDKNAKITEAQKFDEKECTLNQKASGEIIVAGFGSSDCKSRCRSHLKYLG